MKTSTRSLLVLICCLRCVHVHAASEATVEAALQAVHSWYDTIDDGSDQEHLKEFGLVGSGVGPLVQAHQQLAAQLRAHMDRDQFLVHYRGLARMHLLQAHAVSATARDNYAQVFVEEERTMAIEGVPVVAWFEGFIDVTKTPDGWKISSLENVKPEDIIDALGNNTPRHDNAVEAALARLQCKAEDCSVVRRTLPPNGTERMARVTIQRQHDIDTVSLAHLHDGEWLPVDTEIEAIPAPK